MPYEYTLADTIDSDSIIIPLNASSLKTTGCEQQYMYTVFEGLVENREDDKLMMGTALHKFAEVYCLAYPLDRAGQRKLYEHALLAGKAVLKYMPWLHTDYIAAVMACPILPVPIEDAKNEYMREFKITIPWRVYRHLGRKYHVVLCATLDQVTYLDEMIAIIDYKSTRYAQLHDADARYSRESQFIFYMWIFQQFFRRFLHPRYHEAALKDRIIVMPYFIQIPKAPKWIYGIPQGLSQHLVDKFSHQLEATLSNFILPLWFEGHSSRTGWMSNVCAQCNFNKICFEDEAKDDIIKHAFTRKMYASRYFPERYNTTNTNKQNVNI